ncbi:MAG: hypothetical protein K8R48_07995 [Alphaproteobacteria bacterium]|nr:hypothetical protein [Alphaproteobacteria bacterium]
MSYDYETYNEVRKSRRLQEEMLEQQKKLIEAFNAVATELRLLREELAPKKLDKPAGQSPLKKSGE